jgi:hypothetical protein
MAAIAHDSGKALNPGTNVHGKTVGNLSFDGL